MGIIKDAFDLAFRDFVTAGVPGTGANEPIKSEVRSIGPTIEQMLSASGITSTIYPTTSAGITATTNGQLFLVQGTGDDFATLYKNVSGSAVDQGISLPSSAFVEAADAKANTALAPDRPIIEVGGYGFGVPDFDNRYGGGAAVYLPLSSQYFRATAMAAAGFLTPGNADAGGRMAGFTKLAITQPTDTTMRVIFNLDTGQWQLLLANTPITARYITVGLFVVGQPFMRGQSGFKWIEPETSQVFPTAPAVVESGNLYIPRSAVVMAGFNGFDTLAPTDGAWWFELPLQSDPTIARRYIYDRSIVDAGGTYDEAVKYVDGVAAPLDDGFKQIVLATCTGGFVSSEYFQFVGEQGAATAIDQSPFGTDAEALPIRFNSTITDFTDPDILAMSVTRGAIGPLTGDDRSAYIGTPLRPEMGQHGAVRFLAQLAAPGANFDDPRVMLRQGNEERSTGVVRMFRRINDDVAEFVAWVGVATDNTENLLIGFDKNGVGKQNVIVGPPSWHFSDSPVNWVEPVGSAKTDLAYGDHMFATLGQPLPFYPGRVTKFREEDFHEHLTTISSVKTEAFGASTYSVTGKDMMLIDPARLGTTVNIDIRRPGAPNNRFRKQATVYSGPAAVVPGSEARVLIAGDSLVGYGLPIVIAQSLQRLGYTVQTVGTLINEGGGTATAPTWPGEGHPGKTVAQMVGAAAGMDPVTTDFATYMALSDADKNNRNVFLKTFVPGVDPDAYKVTLGGTDYVWSMARYISFTGLPAPTHFVFSGGRNDIFQVPASAVANVEFGYDVRYNQTRAAYPTAPIFFVYFGEPVSVENERDWPAEYAIIQAYRKKVAASRLAGDQNVYFISAFAHQSPEAGDALTVAYTSPESGTIKGVIADTTHFGDVAKLQAADCLAAAINATSGATAITGEIRALPADRDGATDLAVIDSANRRSLMLIDDLYGGVRLAPIIAHPSADRDRGNALPLLDGINGRSPLSYDEVENAIDITPNRAARAKIEYHAPTEFLGPHRAINVRVGKAYRYATVQEADGYVGDVRQRMTGTTAAIADAGDNVIDLIQYQGQSNAGDGSITGQLITGQPAPRHLIVTDGWYSYGDTAVPASPAAVEFSGLPLPSYGGAQGQLPAALMSIAAYDLDRRATDRRVPPMSVTTNWRGSDPLDSFFPATASRFNHENALEQARRARAVARLYGCTLRHDFVFVQGESGAAGDYYTTLNSYLDTVVPIYGGNKGSGDAAYKVFLLQTNSSSTAAAYDAAALAQLRAARDRYAAGVTTLASVMYDGPLEDQAGADIHGSVLGRMIIHERVALAREFVRRKGVPFHPTWPVAGGMTVSGNVVTVPISLATGALALAIDTDRVAAVTNYGFSWFRTGGGGPTISSVAISGANILLTLSGPPASGDKLRYALDNTNPLEGWAGGRGQIYATTNVASPFAARGFNVPATIRQPLVRFEETLP